MTVSNFLSRHPGLDLASPNEIIPIFFQIKELLNNSGKLVGIMEALKDIHILNTVIDILCQAKKASPLIERDTRKTTQPRAVAPIWPLRGETRVPE